MHSMRNLRANSLLLTALEPLNAVRPFRVGPVFRYQQRVVATTVVRRRSLHSSSSSSSFSTPLMADSSPATVRPLRRWTPSSRPSSSSSLTNSDTLVSTNPLLRRSFSSDATATASDISSSSSSSSSASSSSASASTEAKAAPEVQAEKKKPGSILKLISNEIRYANEFINKDTHKSAQGPIKHRLKNVAEYHEMTARVKEEKEKQKAGEISPNENVKDLVLTEYNTTEWDRRLDNLKSRIFRTKSITKKVQKTIDESDNVVAAQARKLQQEWNDTLTDFYEIWSTSQHPMVWKIRDLSDKMTGETDTGFALGQLQRLDPNFDLERFLKYLEEYMIPLVVEGFLSADLGFLKTVTEGNAERYVFQNWKARETLGHYHDKRILRIKRPDLVEGIYMEDTPMLTINFVCQHVHCVKDRFGKIVEGSPTTLKENYYVWIVRRDFEHPFFDWKIMDMISQQMHFLSV